MTDSLGTEVVTPESSAACGVTVLKTGKEYLLAGTVANGNELRIVSCLFFSVKDDPTPVIGALAFEKVTEDLRVVRSKVVNKKLSPGGTSIVYELENKRTFKNQVFTSPMESGCGVTNLKVGREYLLAGTISGFKQRITRCLAIPHADADTTEVLEWKYVDEKLIEELKSEVFA
ncbi:hypothetical protein M3Y98_00116600 [Aphelenchoides besseyi]|nr:hypothetical protein M3Y98_00116600 [Aphelenchoides besseyi]